VLKTSRCPQLYSRELESVDTSDFSWVENDRFYPSSRSEDSISFGLALQNLPASSSVAPLSIQADTVHFEWKTTGKSSSVYQASLFIDSAFKSTYMACCDQPFTGASLAPQLTLLKAGMPLVGKPHAKKLALPHLPCGGRNFEINWSSRLVLLPTESLRE
jgi:hypothetical protein